MKLKQYPDWERLESMKYDLFMLPIDDYLSRIKLKNKLWSGLRSILIKI